ncbi:hypothetical protein PZN02_002721 [Sinorhizobium garamanticum]|uniref:Uncharacterized protein n=1 Tax=Sinorhizobium garamanticum TaxID=680247 RepID=A0ABY8D6F6_9HYPH|nr:hypothetical protein [Sinorhizobium garamanticum]WEX86439.1 hypothetical protein PZN02_002721 [Sinorhizobium garamanticum]
MLRPSNSSKRTPAAGSGPAGVPSGNTATFGVADGLSFAAAPTFAIMALLTSVLSGPADMLCSSTEDASSLTGMVPMYLLMSVFHSAPWLRLISGARRPGPAISASRKAGG